MEEKYWSAPYQMSTGSHFFHCRSCSGAREWFEVNSCAGLAPALNRDNASYLPHQLLALPRCIIARPCRTPNPNLKP